MRAESVPAEMKRIGLIVGILLVAHLVIDAAIGSAAQHVGKPPAPRAINSPMSCSAAPAAIALWACVAPDFVVAYGA